MIAPIWPKFGNKWGQFLFTNIAITSYHHIDTFTASKCNYALEYTRGSGLTDKPSRGVALTCRWKGTITNILQELAGINEMPSNHSNKLVYWCNSCFLIGK